MYPRQANRLILLLALLPGLWACSPSNTSLPTPTASPAPAFTLTPLPIPTLPTATATPLICLDQPGQLQTGQVPTNGAATNFIIYLPPCYDYFTDWHYPVLYLLNGEPFENDPEPPGEQWLHIGAPAAADFLIHSGKSAPFIIVFPEDRYWNVVQGTLFGQFFVNDIVPFVDKNFRTIADRPHRAIGGLSRGGGWALQLSFLHPELFGAVGLHSPAIFTDERTNLVFLITHHTGDWPRLYIDSGYDQDRGYNTSMEALFTQYGIPHEWHLNLGEHTLAYWQTHIMEYLVWYAEGFRLAGDPLPTPTPTLTVVPSATSTVEPASSSTVEPLPSGTAAP
jgi:enterochelin esterase-like enzyme